MNVSSVHLIGSVPGRHTGPDLSKFGHMKLRQVLKTNIQLEDEEKYRSGPIVGQVK